VSDTFLRGQQIMADDVVTQTAAGRYLARPTA
jgi:hypothetical protein